MSRKSSQGVAERLDFPDPVLSAIYIIIWGRSLTVEQPVCIRQIGVQFPSSPQNMAKITGSQNCNCSAKPRRQFRDIRETRVRFSHGPPSSARRAELSSVHHFAPHFVWGFAAQAQHKKPAQRWFFVMSYWSYKTYRSYFSAGTPFVSTAWGDCGGVAGRGGLPKAAKPFRIF